MSYRSLSLCALVLFSTSVALAQQTGSPAKLHPALIDRLDREPGPAKTWVFFADKGLTSREAMDAALNDVERTYNSHALQRRALRGDNAARGGRLVDEHDIPVHQAYIDAVLDSGVAIDNTSRWLNAITVYATREQATQIAKLPFVDRLEPVARSWRKTKPIESAALPEPQPASDDGSRSINYGVSATQLTQINLPNLHDAGYTGQGVIIGILDTGFRRDHAAFTNPAKPLQVLAEYDFINNDNNTGIQPGDPSDQHTHGTLILGCIAAYLPGTVVGGAFDAQFVLAKTEDTTQEVPAEEDDYVAGLEFTESHGVDMTTSSLGYIDWYTQAQLNGVTAVTTIAMNIHTSLGVHHTNAAGNENHDTNPATSHLIAPADAFKCLTIGAISSSGAIASFSSDGPTADGRVKPELLARGVGTATVSTTGTSGTTTADGTSLSTPLAACAVACLIQARPWWNVNAMRENLFNTADYFVQNGTYDPQYVRGYGVINAFAAYNTCTSQGVITLDANRYACADVVGLHLLDCDLDTNHNFVETAQINLASTSEPAGETVTLVELGAGAGQFDGVLNIATTNAPGVLLVAPGDTITATYLDGNDGQGGQNIIRIDTAAVDCTPPTISNVEALNVGPRSATVRFNTNEPARATVHYGLSCDNLDLVASVATFSTTPTVTLNQVLDDLTYYYSVEATDEAGNTIASNNGGACYSFTTPDVPDYFTELFTSNNDLDYHSIEFTPNGSGYTGCAYPILNLPVDPNGGISIAFTQDDQFKTINLPTGQTVPFFGGAYPRLYVSSNGFLTFGDGDTTAVETVAAHFSRRRVAALFDDLSPQVSQARTTYKLLEDRIAITFWNVPENGTTNSNTFQIELFFGGLIRLSYLGIAANDGLTGLARGTGTPSDFYMSDLTTLDQCGPRPPLAYDVSAQTDVNTNVDLTLSAIDDGQPGPLSYEILSLPARGRLIDPGAGPILAAPYTLVDFGHVVSFDPPTYFKGAVAFNYRVDDGGSAPNGGLSNTALAAVMVGSSELIYDFPLNANPGWAFAGQWAFGDPLGQGGASAGSPDPQNGFTGTNVYGVNLAGNYSLSIGGPHTLTTAPLDLTHVTDVRLVFRRWLNTDYPPYVRSKVEATADGDNWATLWEHTGSVPITDNLWLRQEFSLSAVADDQPAVRVRWSYQISSGAWAYSGWNIDDIQVWGLVQLTPAVCAGDLSCDGVVDFFDIDPFVAALSYPNGIGWPGECPWISGDCDDDGDVDFFDIDAFVSRLGATCP